MTFTHNFNTSLPTGTDRANQLDSYIRQAVKQALDERFGLEHISLASEEPMSNNPDSTNAQGRHIAGKVGVLFWGTRDELLAISGAGHGAIGFAHDEDNFYWNDGIGVGNGQRGWKIFSLNSETVFPDNTSLVRVTTGGIARLGMNREHQQWVNLEVLTGPREFNTDCNTSNIFKINASVDFTLANPINMKSGETYVWVIEQSSNGNDIITYGTKFKFPGGVKPPLSTEAGAVDVLTSVYVEDDFLCSILYDFK